MQVLVREGGELSHKIGEVFESLITPIKAINNASSSTIAGDAGEEESAGLPIERDSLRASEQREGRLRLV
ncbi:hypothetical protein QFC22_003950 [Naganishia vaughanmartiniae]|uniref:Uncharacterized protein n=1 Tax=Naganishia vaughanmartiniae TaxID=1424756 RepID=A0ACC2X5R5_9TREE|nr:hypothetical protein QFC22_003950 [Naganishia vaughanmartiniae]